MSISDRFNLRAKRDDEARARAAYEKVVADREAAEQQAADERQVRLAAYDAQRVEEWDLDRVTDELEQARSRLMTAVLETPVYRALLEEYDLRARIATQSRHVEKAAARLGLEVDLGTMKYAEGQINHTATVTAAIQAELNRRASTRAEAENAARDAYIEDEQQD